MTAVKCKSYVDLKSKVILIIERLFLEYEGERTFCHEVKDWTKLFQTPRK